MRDILLQRGIANVMLDHIRRKNHTVPRVGRELTHHEIFGEIIFQPFKSPDRLQYRASRSDGGAHREMHAFNHPRH